MCGVMRQLFSPDLGFSSILKEDASDLGAVIKMFQTLSVSRAFSLRRANKKTQRVFFTRPGKQVVRARRFPSPILSIYNANGRPCPPMCTVRGWNSVWFRGARTPFGFVYEIGTVHYADPLFLTEFV